MYILCIFVCAKQEEKDLPDHPDRQVKDQLDQQVSLGFQADRDHRGLKVTKLLLSPVSQ